MTPEEFEAWMAYMAVEGDPFMRMIDVMRNGFCLMANAWMTGGSIKPEMIDPYYETPPRQDDDSDE